MKFIKTYENYRSLFETRPTFVKEGVYKMEITLHEIDERLPEIPIHLTFTKVEFVEQYDIEVEEVEGSVLPFPVNIFEKLLDEGYQSYNKSEFWPINSIIRLIIGLTNLNRSGGRMAMGKTGLKFVGSLKNFNIFDYIKDE